jgi:hypothetical protein
VDAARDAVFGLVFCAERRGWDNGWLAGFHEAARLLREGRRGDVSWWEAATFLDGWADRRAKELLAEGGGKAVDG